MNRIQFLILNGLSGLVVLLLFGTIFLGRQNNFEQNRLALAQQALQQGQAFQGNLKQLAMRIIQVSQANGGDQALKDLLTRQQISFTPQGDATGGPAAAPAPATH